MNINKPEKTDPIKDTNDLLEYQKTNYIDKSKLNRNRVFSGNKLIYSSQTHENRGNGLIMTN